MSLGKVSIAIEAAMAGFESDMGRAQRLLEKETKRMERDLESMRGKAKAVGAAIGASIVAGLGIVAAATKMAINDMDELSKTAQKVGMPTDEISALAYAADLSDVNVEQLTTGLVKLTKNMSDAAMGTGEAQKGFKALGIDVKNADGSLKSSGKVLGEIATKFGTYRDGAEKTALAVNLFGKSGAELIPLLNSGAEGLEEMRKEAESLGITFDDSTGKKAEAFNDNLTRLGAVMKGVWRQIAAELLPMLVNLTERFFGSAKGAESLGKLVSFAVSGIKVLTTVGLGVVGVFKTVGEALGGVAATATALFTDGFGAALDTWQEVQLDVIGNVAGTIGDIRTIWSDAGADVLGDAPGVSQDLAAPVLQAEEKVKTSGKRIVDEAARIYKQVEDKIAALQRDIDTFGMSEKDMQLYDLQKMQATPDQLARAGGLLDTSAMQQADKGLYDRSLKADMDRAAGIRDITEAYAEEIAVLGMSAREQERYIALSRAGVDALSAEGQAISDLISRSQDLRESRMWMEDLGDGLYDLFAGVLDYTKGAKEAFGDFIDDIRQLAIRLLADAALRQLGEYLKSLGSSSGDGAGGGWGSFLSMLGSAFGGGRAGGGPVSAGKFYEVNERAPELYSSGGRTWLMAGAQNGQVTPMSASRGDGGGGLTVIAVYSEEEARRVAKQVMRSDEGARIQMINFQQNRKQAGF